VFKGRLVIVFGTGFSGVFVYSPAPGAGNLIASVAALAGTDPYGNKYPSGISSQSGGIEAILSGKELAWDAPADHPSNLPAVFAAPSAATGNSLEITTGTGSGGVTAGAITLYDSAASSTVPAIPSGSPGIFVAFGCPLVTDTWHTLGTAAQYSITRARYRMDAFGYLELDIQVTSSGTVGQDTAFSVTLPAAYRPPVQRDMPLVQTVGQNSGSNWPRLYVTAAGGVHLFVRSNTASDFGTHCSIPLD
jgi:hypothetical protein